MLGERTMFIINSLFFVLTVIVLCDSGFVDNLEKCGLNDGVCLKNFYQSTLRRIAKTGVPEIGLPPIDPLELSNVTVSALNLIDITLVRGYVKGIESCIVTNAGNSIEDKHSFMELLCDILVKGHYKIQSTNPIVKTLFGGESIHGDGNGKINIEKLFIRFDFFYFVERRNGETYFKWKSDKIVYTYDVKGKMSFFADNLYLGKQEASQHVISLLNENWKLLMSSYGQPFMDKAMHYMQEFFQRFLQAVPTKYFIKEDLSSYVKNVKYE